MDGVGSVSGARGRSGVQVGSGNGGEARFPGLGRRAGGAHNVSLPLVAPLALAATATTITTATSPHLLLLVMPLLPPSYALSLIWGAHDHHSCPPALLSCALLLLLLHMVDARRSTFPRDSFGRASSCTVRFATREKIQRRSIQSYPFYPFSIHTTSHTFVQSVFKSSSCYYNSPSITCFD